MIAHPLPVPVPRFLRRPLFGAFFPEPDVHYALADRYSINQTVIRVRRSSDNAETDVTSSQVGPWLESWVGSGNDGFVVTWYDLTSNGNDATQATAGGQPKIVNSGSLVTEDGLPVLQFDALDDELDLTSPVVARSVFAVTSKRNVHPATANIGSSVHTTSASYIFLSTASSSHNYAISIDGTNSDTGSAYINGALVGTGRNIGSARTPDDTLQLVSVIMDSGMPASAFTHIGANRFAASTSYSTVEPREIIYYTSDQSANRAAIDAHLMATHGI